MMSQLLVVGKRHYGWLETMEGSVGYNRTVRACAGDVGAFPAGLVSEGKG